MRKKQVWKYFCDFCKKTNYSVSAMKRHELSCTMNPNRICKVCLMDHGEWSQDEFEQKPIIELLSLLPDPLPYLYKEVSSHGWVDVFSDTLSSAVNTVLPQLREVCGNCPACIMAALRQKGIPVTMATDFDFSKEMKLIFDDINDMNNVEMRTMDYNIY